MSLVLGALALAQPPAAPPAQAAAPEPRWTPSAEAPAGVLAHALEGQRHDFFIELAQQGNIELVFFGTTEAEMWWWPDRGRGVWDREFGSLAAANFGSQGTHLESLVWRMQNGELDGFEARLIVLQAGLLAGADRTPAAMIAGYETVLDEIRLRQPQAKVLLFAPLPRGGNLEDWRERAAEMEAQHAGLVDDETVFYTDIGDRFFNGAGSFRNETWALDLANRGTQSSAYEFWAEAMQPWIDRYVR
jgi:beta-glucosidase